MATRIVVDTNVLAGALLRGEGQNRKLLRACFEDRLIPIVGQALFLEYEEVLGRTQLFRNSPLPAPDRQHFFEAFLSLCDWVEVHFLWRPNLQDEDDNHIVELAVAGGAAAIVTNNVSDFRGAELRFPQIQVLTPGAALKELL